MSLSKTSPSPHQVVQDAAVPSPVHGKPAASAPVPAVGAPLDGVDPLAAVAGVRSVTREVLLAAGYQVHEHLVSGEARSFELEDGASASVDGHWRTRVSPGPATPYCTRVLVFAPVDPLRFSGTVAVEWNNVTRGDDAMPDLIFAHNHQFRAGDVVVGVSAQFGGAEAARRADPEHRGGIDHPGDSFSYDIFSQVGMAVRERWDELLGGLRPRVVLGVGESQSAIRLATYVDGVAPVDHVFDGYLLHSRAGFLSAPLQEAVTGLPAIPGAPPGVPVVMTGSPVPEFVTRSNEGRADVTVPVGLRLRTDLVEPVLQVLAQSDVFGPPHGTGSFGPATQEQSASVTTWQLAGTSHVDAYVDGFGTGDTGSDDVALAGLRALLDPPSTMFGQRSDRPVNAGQQHLAVAAALRALTRWAGSGGVDGGEPAPVPALFEGQTPVQDGTAAPVWDEHGNVAGGVRLPAVEVPLATLTGEANSPGPCTLGGTTTPLPRETLARLYPTPESFAARYADAVDTQVRDGFVTPEDGEVLKRAAGRLTF